MTTTSPIRQRIAAQGPYIRVEYERDQPVPRPACACAQYRASACRGRSALRATVSRVVVEAWFLQPRRQFRAPCPAPGLCPEAIQGCVGGKCSSPRPQRVARQSNGGTLVFPSHRLAPLAAAPCEV